MRRTFSIQLDWKLFEIRMEKVNVCHILASILRKYGCEPKRFYITLYQAAYKEVVMWKIGIKKQLDFIIF